MRPSMRPAAPHARGRTDRAQSCSVADGNRPSPFCAALAMTTQPQCRQVCHPTRPVKRLHAPSGGLFVGDESSCGPNVLSALVIEFSKYTTPPGLSELVGKTCTKTHAAETRASQDNVCQSALGTSHTTCNPKHGFNHRSRRNSMIRAHSAQATTSVEKVTEGDKQASATQGQNSNANVGRSTNNANKEKSGIIQLPGRGDGTYRMEHMTGKDNEGMSITMTNHACGAELPQPAKQDDSAWYMHEEQYIG